MRKRVLVVLAVALVLGIDVFTTDRAQAATGKPIELKIATFVGPAHVMYREVLVPWTKMLEERTGGRVKGIIYPMDQLLKLRDLYDGVLAGTADMACGFHFGSPAKFEVTMHAFGLPQLFPNSRVGSHVMWDMFEKEPVVRNQYDDVKVVWLHSTTPLIISTSKKAVRTLEDLKGMKIRTGGGIQTSALREVGAIPVELPTGDAYTAIERGTVEGTTIAYEGLISFKFGEVLRHHTGTNFGVSPFWGIMNKKKWESLPPDIQKIIDSMGGAWAAEFIGSAWDREDEKAIQTLKKVAGHEFIDLPAQEEARWKKAMQPIWENEFVKKHESRGEPAKKMLDEMLQLTDKYSK